MNPGIKTHLHENSEINFQKTSLINSIECHSKIEKPEDKIESSESDKFLTKKRKPSRRRRLPAW